MELAGLTVQGVKSQNQGVGRYVCFSGGYEELFTSRLIQVVGRNQFLAAVGLRF